MKRLFALFGTLAILLNGGWASSDITYSPLWQFTSDLSPRSQPAQISRTTNWDSLRQMGFARIGKIKADVVVYTEWYDDDRDTVSRNRALNTSRDLIQVFCEEAAARGGDLVALYWDNVVEGNPVEKFGKESHYGGIKTTTTTHSSYGRVKSQETTTTIGESRVSPLIHGHEYHLVSEAAVWRYDPDLAKRVGEAEKKEKEDRLVAARKEEEMRLMRDASEARRKEEIKIRREAFAAIMKKYEENLYPPPEFGLSSVKVNDKYGFNDMTGRIVIKPQYSDVVSYFYEGLAPVSVGDGEERKWGFIDQTGRWVVPPQYEGAGMFSEGLASVRVAGEDGKKWGYIDKTGRMVIPPRFVNAFDFQQGLARVIIDEKYCYVDKTGNIVIEPQFDQAFRFSEGLAAVEVDEKYRYVDKTGNIVIKPQYDEASEFSEGLAAAKVDGKYGFIDKNANFVITPRFTEAYRFRNGIAGVKIGSTPGYVTKSGVVTYEP